LGKLQILNRFPYIVADLQALWPFSGVEFCGILGSSFLHQFRWEIDFTQAKIKAYFGAEPYLGNYVSREPIHWSQAGIPYVGVDFQGKTIAFDIDLGDNGSGRMIKENLLFLQSKEEVLKTHTQDVVTISALSQSTEFRLKALRFANVLYPEIVLQESQQNALGLSFFKRHNLVLDFPFNMLYLQHHKDYAKREEVDKSGVRIVLEDNKLIVFSIKPLKGALVNSLQIGDEILSVNGKDKLRLHEARDFLRLKEGTRLSLEIKRKSKLYQAEITLGEDPL
jgi:hypothetical protein